MAITITGKPHTVMPAYNDIAWTVTSTNIAYCDFRYVCDVYVNGNYVTRLKLFPDVNGAATFRVNRVLEDYVSSTPNQNVIGVVKATGENTAYYVLKFGEEYDSSVGCGSGSVVYPDLTVGDKMYVFNGAMQYDEFVKYRDLSYGTGSYDQVAKAYWVTHPLTNIPDGTYIGIGDRLVVDVIDISLSILHPTERATAFDITVITYDEAGNTLRYSTITQTSGITGDDHLVYRIGIGPDNLNNNSAFNGNITEVNSSPSAGHSNPIIDINTYSYDVRVQAYSTHWYQFDKMFSFKIDNRRTGYEPFRYMWLNRLGGYDAYTFTSKNSRKVNSTTKSWNKLLQPGYSIGDRQETVLSTDATDATTAMTNWLTQAEANWLEELFTSPDVYMTTITPSLDVLSVTDNGSNSYQLFTGNQDLYKFRKDTEYSTSNNDMFFMRCSGNNNKVLTNTTVDPKNPYLGINEGQVGSFAVDLINTENGKLYFKGFTSKSYPVVLNTKTYEEKNLSKTKNINYTVEFKNSIGINVQRN